MRLGRPANDNAGQPRPLLRMLALTTAAALAVLALRSFGVF